MKCPICKGEEFIKSGTVHITDGEGFVVNAENCFVCKCCGYTLIFDDRIDSVHRGYWPHVEEDE